MAHFAKVENGVVTNVIRADDDFQSEGWIQTSYNTRGGIHYQPNTDIPSEDQSKALRKNYAGIGFSYDAEKDAFIPPQQFPSWILNEDTCLWEAPIPYPQDGKYYIWNETTQSWEEK